MIANRPWDRRPGFDSVWRGLGASGPARLLLAVFAGFLCVGCGKQHEWTPGPEHTSSRFLDREVEEALTALGEARNAVRKDPAAAERSLDEARHSLLRLRGFYLPLLQARDGAYEALRRYHLGDSKRALEELAVLEVVLLEVSDLGDARLSRELDSPLEAVVDARAAIRAGRAEAPELIEGLGSRLNLLLLKGDLALHGTELGDG